MKTLERCWMCLILFHLVKSSNFSYGNQSFLQNNLIFNTELPENALVTTPELIKKFGYPVEIHTVTTDDGYILELHRIPYSSKHGFANNNPAVLIQHGFLSNSGEAVLAGPGNSLGLFLSDTGHDVWIGNGRGNRYSRQHVSLSPDDPQFWDFTWADIGYYDLPAMIDYILEITRQEKIFYIGHSQGTTISYVLCSERPEYNDKLKAVISLAPAAYMSKISSPYFQFVAQNQEQIFSYLYSLGIYKLEAPPRAFVRIGQIFCNKFAPTQPLCQLLFFTLAGFDYNHFNSTLIPVMLGHFPDAGAVKELNHFAQIIVSGKFRRYDYGYRKNVMVYNSATPPSFNLTKVTVPVALFYSANDILSSAFGAEQIYRELGNPIDKFLLPQKPNHFAYHIGMNMREVYFEKVLNIFKRY